MSEKAKLENSVEEDNNEEDYRPVISANANYHKYLQLVHSDSIYEEDFDAELRGNGFDDDSLSSPTYEAAAQSDTSPVYQDPVEHERQMLEWKEELLKVEGEIATLRQVLGTKVRHASELKRKMGITPFQEFKEDLTTGIQHIKSSDSYQKTAAVTKTVGEKTSAAFSNIGSSMSRKIGDLRNSSTFKSLEESVGNTYASVKAKVSGSRSSTSIDENLKEGEDNPAATTPTTPTDLPEQKVPL